MGKFIDNHVDYDTYVKKNGYSTCGTSVAGFNPYAAAVMDPTTALIQGLLNGALSIGTNEYDKWYNSSGSGGGGSKVSSKESSESGDNSEEIAELQSQISALLKAEGVNSLSDYENNITAKTQEVNNIETKDLQPLLKKRTALEAKPEGAEEFREKAKTDVLFELDNEISELEGSISIKNREILRMNGVKGQVEELERQIEILNGNKSDVGYDVEQEITDIKTFMEKLSYFNSHPNDRNAAKALKDAVGKEGAGAIDNATIRNAYKLVANRIEEVLNSK